MHPDKTSPCVNIQLMHSFAVDIRICQPENSDGGLTNPDVMKNNALIVLLFDTVSLFLVLFKVFSYLYIYLSQMFLVHFH